MVGFPIQRVVARGGHELNSKTDEIHRVVGVIREIAEQTNLLAFERGDAPAGEQGRFAVAADEPQLSEHTHPPGPRKSVDGERHPAANPRPGGHLSCKAKTCGVWRAAITSCCSRFVDRQARRWRTASSTAWINALASNRWPPSYW